MGRWDFDDPRQEALGRVRWTGPSRHALRAMLFADATEWRPYRQVNLGQMGFAISGIRWLPGIRKADLRA
jgi:hypothetical protein